MNSKLNSTKVAVIGGGPGGYTAAYMAADLGMKVTLIDTEHNPGGVCLYRGCIPSKALLHIAKVVTESREAAKFGIDFGEPVIHFDKIQSWKNKVVEKMSRGLRQLCKLRNVQFLQGKASFQDSGTVKVKLNDGSSKVLSFDRFILATGSRPAGIPGVELNSPNILDSTSALELKKIPKNILVIGGGYIGLELGIVYSALGCQVSIVEMTSGLLPGVDRDLVNVLLKRMKAQTHSIMLNTKVIEIKEAKKGIGVRLEGENVQEPEQMFEKALIAVGRTSNTRGLGLEHTKVQTDEKGFIQVDGQRRTADPAIYAIGDSAGEPMLAHKAAHEGHIAAEAVAGRNTAYEPRAIPAVVFTDPEIAWCGLTEAQANLEKQAIKICRFPWAASGKANILGYHDGMTKLIIEPETERVLGVGIVGSGAGELIAEGVLAIEMAAIVSDIQWSIHAHPTLSETLMEAAETFFGHSTHIYALRSELI